MKQATVSEMIQMIGSEVKGTTIVTVDIETDPRMRKTGNPFLSRGVVKRSTLNGMIGFDYSNGINRRAGKEGKEERQAKSRAWGVLTPDRLFVTHKGEFYLQLQVENVTKAPRFFDRDGIEIPKADIEPFLPKRASEGSTQADIENKLIVRDIKMSNVKSIRFKGEDYKLVADELEAETAW